MISNGIALSVVDVEVLNGITIIIRNRLMGYSKVALLLALLLCSAMPALIYIPGVQLDPLMLYQVQVACDRL